MNLRRAGSAFSLSAAYTVLSVGLGFITTPLILRLLGQADFGKSRTLVDIFNYLSLFELGLAHGLLPSLVTAVHTNDIHVVRRVLNLGVREYAKVALLALLAGAVLVTFLPNLLPRLKTGDLTLQTSAALLLIPFIWYPLIPYRALLEVREQGYLVMLGLIGQNILTTLLTVALASAGAGLTGQTLALSAGQLPVMIWIYLKASRGASLAAVSKAEPLAGTSLNRTRWSAVIHEVCGRISIASDAVVIAAVMGGAAVTPFVITQRLSMSSQAIWLSAGNVTWPGLIGLLKSGEKQAAARHLREITRVVVTGATLLAIIILSYNEAFVRLWIGQGQYAGSLVTTLTCMNMLANVIFTLWFWPVVGAGLLPRWVPYACIGTIINLTISVLATQWLGLAGPLLGTAIVHITISWWAVPRIVGPLFDISVRQLWMPVLRILAILVPAAALQYLLIIRFPPAGWPELCASVCVSVLMLTTLAALGLFDADERRWAWNRIRGLANI